MKKNGKKLLGLILLVVLCFAFSLTGSAAKANTVSEKNAVQIVVSGDKINVAVFGSINLDAEIRGTESKAEITWSSSDESVASVDQSGNVTGKKPGKATISASAQIDGKTYKGIYPINVLSLNSATKNLLEKNPLLSYQYSYIDDYYYANDKKCWQDQFGFARIYDILAPYIALEYDYTRVFFTYEGQDFMVQFWKGQYGYVFYGSEIGIYSKPADGKDVGWFTFFKKPDEKYWPKMEMTLYHQNLQGEYIREFTRDYDTYWWCTGFKPGHLRVVEPANELRTVNRITFKDKEMAKLFANGLADCGFEKCKDKDSLSNDGYYVKGKNVYVNWQNLSEAENTMPVKIAGGALIALNIMAIIFSIFTMGGLGSLLLLIIL